MTENRPPSPFTEVSTEKLYEQWADTYDTDGNVLQFVDDLQLTRLLPRFVSSIQQSTGPSLKILDLGCGTGRNTLKLEQAGWNRPVAIEGWDGSEAMLEIARMKCRHTSHLCVDLANRDNLPSDSQEKYDGLVSTLVLEHIPIDTYFSIIFHVLRPGACALVTNMHEDMGRLSRAGYKTSSGERFKAQSFVYRVDEMAVAAKKAGLDLMDGIKERAVEADMIEGGVVDGIRIEKGQVAERARKWIDVKIWVGMLLRKP